MLLLYIFQFVSYFFVLTCKILFLGTFLQLFLAYKNLKCRTHWTNISFNDANNIIINY